MPVSTDTIIAKASADVMAPVAILRISGSHALDIFRKHFVSRTLKHSKPVARMCYFGKLKSDAGEILDDCLAIFFAAPHSFTGEDVVEFHCHGNPHNLTRITEILLRQNASIGLRAALAGEFSKRAFANGKMDLTQAEALHALISADSEQAARQALGNLDGELSKIIKTLHAQLRESLALMEAAFEFPEEDIQTFDRDDQNIRLTKISSELKKLLAAFQTSKLVESGVSIAIVGEPNVGKSSLLNSLLVEDRAIVSPIAGTTRDVIEGVRFINGVRFVFRDTAGLRDTPDAIEKIGITKAQEWIERSNIILFVCDQPSQIDSLPQLVQVKDQILVKVLNKVDLAPDSTLPKGFDFGISAKSGYGLESLVNFFSEVLKLNQSVQNCLQITSRQHVKLQQATQNVEAAQKALSQHPLNEEVVCEELRQACLSLEEIVGIISNDEVLGEIFSRFCIGK